MHSKQREALLAVYDCANDGVLAIRRSAFEKVLEALKEPLRNCDRFNSGDVKKDAQDAMEAILAEGVAGYRGIAEYLLSPVTGKLTTEKLKAHDERYMAEVEKALAEAAGTEAKPARASLFPKGVRPATEEEVAAGDAQWCEACRMTCPCKGKDILVHGCAMHNPDKALS